MICQCLADQLFAEAKDAGKSRYLAITEFNNCFIIQSPSLFFIIIFSMIAQGSDLPFSYKSVVSITHEQNKTCLVFFETINMETQLDSIAHEQTIICGQLFAGHVVCSRPMKSKKSMHRMIILVIIHSTV